MTLFEINEQIQKAIELGFDPETGEILDASALEQLQIDRDEKIENICLYIKDLTAEAKALAEKGTKALILVAQETTLYGKDLYGRKSLHLLLKELCRIEALNGSA